MVWGREGCDWLNEVGKGDGMRQEAGAYLDNEGNYTWRDIHRRGVLKKPLTRKEGQIAADAQRRRRCLKRDQRMHRERRCRNGTFWCKRRKRSLDDERMRGSVAGPGVPLRVPKNKSNDHRKKITALGQGRGGSKGAEQNTQREGRPREEISSIKSVSGWGL